MDFEKEAFGERLESAGFNRTRPSVWIWEGVAMYLPLGAIGDTFRQVTSLAAEGSVLAMTYRIPNELPFGAIGRIAIPAMFAAAGEPLLGTLEPSALATMLAPEWRVTYDDDARGWRSLTGSSAVPSKAFLSERLAVMTRAERVD